MSLDNNGYLGKQVDEIILNNFNKFKDLFNLITEFNSFIQTSKFKFDFAKLPDHKSISICIFIRILNSYQSIYILCQRNLEDDAKCVLRSSFEHLLYLKHISLDDNFSEKFINSDTLNRKKLANVVVNDKYNCFSNEIKLKLDDEYKKSIDEIIELNNIKAIPTYEKLSEDCGLIKYYNLIYRNLSNDVHPNPRNLEKYVNMKNGFVEYFNTVPLANTIEYTLITSVDIMLYAFEEICKIVNLDIIEEINSYRKRFNEIAKVYEL